ncbi:hypothetical protein ACIBKY_31785 [Nonomuraea sp. NPDC050394]|uniref:hypothetical protein n=1 Tax=Nonomuraea sp. NPDC050394 TaxID=3364363 RepID=UPI00378944FE
MTVTRFQDLPLADRGREWDSAAADKRVREWAGIDDKPNDAYKRAFVWYDGDDAGEFGAYKLPIADVVNGELKAVPRAVMSAGGILDGARGGVKLPRDEIGRVRDHLAKYYAKMDERAPWER